jgi:hypothetical protein
MSEGSTVDNWEVVGTGVAVLVEVSEVHPAINIESIRSNTTVKIILSFIIAPLILFVRLTLSFDPDPPIRFIVSREQQPQKELVPMRSIPEYIGLVGVGVSALVVLVAVGLLVLAVILIGVGGIESATNPHTAQDTARELQNATAQINNGAAGISLAVGNVTGG